jgi:YD repeat-containing protein
MEWSMGFDPARLVDVLTRYDAADRPVEIVYRNAEQQPLHRIELTYDGNGRLFRERVIIGDDAGVSGQWFPSNQAIAAGTVDPPSAQEQRQLTALLKKMLPDRMFTTHEYEYDRRGRVSERRTTMAGLSETLHTYSYDDHDNVIEEHHEEASREAGLDRAGRRVTLNETTSESWTRYEYRYDDYGNWVERIVLRRDPPDSGFRRSSIERRTITYF